MNKLLTNHGNSTLGSIAGILHNYIKDDSEESRKNLESLIKRWKWMPLSEAWKKIEKYIEV